MLDVPQRLFLSVFLREEKVTVVFSGRFSCGIKGKVFPSNRGEATRRFHKFIVKGDV